MRLVYDHQIFSRQQYGGISRYYYELAARIPRAGGYEVEIVSPYYINAYLRNFDHPDVKLTGRHVVKLPKTGKLIVALNDWVSRRYMRNNPPDLIHETYYRSTSLASRRVPTVITVHDMTHEKLEAHFSEKDRTSLYKKQAVQRADHIICISHSTQNDLVEILDVDPGKTSVIHHGYTLQVKHAAPAERLVHRPYLLYVGNRGGYKNFEGLVRAYAASPRLRSDFRLVCFGGGPFTSAEQAGFKTLGLKEDAVQYIGGDDGLLLNLYTHASAFVMPSLYEGFGIPLLEAMSFGCPVVCSDTSSLPEVAEQAAEYFDPRDTDSIRTAVEAVVYADERSQALKTSGLERIGHFSWERCAEETRAVYAAFSDHPSRV